MPGHRQRWGAPEGWGSPRPLPVLRCAGCPPRSPPGHHQPRSARSSMESCSPSTRHNQELSSQKGRLTGYQRIEGVSHCRVGDHGSLQSLTALQAAAMIITDLGCNWVSIRSGVEASRPFCSILVFHLTSGTDITSPSFGQNHTFFCSSNVVFSCTALPACR